MRNDHKFHYCRALYVTCFKIDMITTYFWPPIRFFASHALKDDLTQLSKISSHFTLQIKYLVSLLWKPLHCLLVLFRTFGSKTAHFCTFCRHLKLSSDYRAVFYSFSLCDNFYPESHSIRRAACFWHDEKNNSDERDTRLKLYILFFIYLPDLLLSTCIYSFDHTAFLPFLSKLKLQFSVCSMFVPVLFLFLPVLLQHLLFSVPGHHFDVVHKATIT